MSWAIKLQAGTSYLKGMSEIEGQSTISAVQFLLAFFLADLFNCRPGGDAL